MQPGRLDVKGGIAVNSSKFILVFIMLADDSFRQLLDFFNLSFSGYRRVRKGVKKRVHRHMQQLGCRRISAYLALLETDRQCRRQCEQLLKVSISRFFRDRQLWETLQQKLLPEMAARYPRRLTVWSAGCAAGEEAYSIKIVWLQWQRQRSGPPHLVLVATDSNRDMLTRAREGVYRASSLREVPTDWVANYFTVMKPKNTYRIQPRLRRGITWMQHNLLDQPPRVMFNLIFLRNNLLTYYRPTVQEKVIGRILNQLTRPGLLIVGARERCPPGADGLSRHPAAAGVLLKR